MRYTYPAKRRADRKNFRTPCESVAWRLRYHWCPRLVFDLRANLRRRIREAMDSHAIVPWSDAPFLSRARV